MGKIKRYIETESDGRKVNLNYFQRKFLDIPYATVSTRQTLDIYLPDGEGPFPVIVSIHGGAFAFGDSRGTDCLSALHGLERDYAVVSVNYRLSGEAIFPADVEDVKAAIRFVRTNAAAFSLNPDKIATWGGSAGGSLSALCATSGDAAEFKNPNSSHIGVSDRVQAAIVWYAPINFLTMDQQFLDIGIMGENHNSADSYESELMGQQITLIPEQVAKHNPETYITPNCPPVFIQHGWDDIIIPRLQSVEFANKLEAVLGSEMVFLELLDNAGHADSQFETPENIEKVLNFLDKHLK
ncbi:alpha/beta hydrolase [Paenibacillus pectinilyticus]|uniref:Alpha/beta hydrolase n=1 Tax=Paenibacillus pectinilyticus TaxID=512399 RepID=A0A1C0ZWT4_9BACL|nr:alpha/beta hydrolase [Paenibacillus pectinilyticus]OCT12574.1 alpha/beta hydrolase [Paenibacillus pectinilyticus]